ncbi:hypothetical protein AMTRI_Chr02g258330 [Amborella trichopoda]
MRCLTLQNPNFALYPTPAFVTPHSVIPTSTRLSSTEHHSTSTILSPPPSAYHSLSIILSSRRLPRHIPTAQPLNALFVLSRNSPASTGDYSTFIPLSAGLLFLYWVTNFVVPNLVMPQANTNQTQEDSPPAVQESSQDNSAPTSSQTIKTTSNKSRSKKRRSKSSKRSELMIETQFPKFKSHH